MKIIDRYIFDNKNYKRQAIFKPQGIMIHSIGVAQPAAKPIINSWSRPDTTQLPMRYIEANGNVYEALPYYSRCLKCYHCGSGNDTILVLK